MHARRLNKKVSLQGGFETVSSASDESPSHLEPSGLGNIGLQKAVESVRHRLPHQLWIGVSLYNVVV
jgi:hypothetical protein